MAVALKHLVPKPTARQQAAAGQRRAQREQRQQAVGAARRGLILEAARAVFAESGLDGASLREIARRAGYTPGALYSYFDSKEAIYAELLGESLTRLQAAVQAAKPPTPRKPRARAVETGAGKPEGSAAAQHLVAKARGWFDFYARHPRDLDLGFYLVHGLGPKGLTSELNHQLNQRLLDALAPCEEALRALGCPADEARREHAALFAHGVGLLLLQHTGRIRLFGQDAAPLFDEHLRHLLQRLGADAALGSATTGEGVQSASARRKRADQPGLFGD